MGGYTSSFTKLATAVRPDPTGPEDYFDKLNFMVAPGILLGLSAVIGMKQFVFQAIQCWNQKGFDNERMEYIENFCWVTNTFYYTKNEAKFHSNPELGRKIYYYQWIPFLLMAQAILFHVPHVMWLLLSSNTGIDVQQIAEQSQSMKEDTEETKRRQKIIFLANSLLKFLRYREWYNQDSLYHCFGSGVVNKPTVSMHLVLSYLLVKAAYIGNCVGQLHMMQAYLGMETTDFGLKLLNNLQTGKTWELTNLFPRVTFCRLAVVKDKTYHTYIVQCVLPLNMLHEKAFIFVWFLVMLLLCCNVYSLVHWSTHILLTPSRRSEVKKYLKIAEFLEVNNFRRRRYYEHEFVETFLKTDGVFVLAIISNNAGDLVTAEVVSTAFQKWEPLFDAQQFQLQHDSSNSSNGRRQ